MIISSEILIIACKKTNLKLFKNWFNILLLFLLLFITHLSLCLKWSSSTAASYTITSNEWSFSGYGFSQIDAALSGPISNSLYLMYYITTPQRIVVRKINPDDSVAWMTAIGPLGPSLDGFRFDSNESKVYFSSYTNPLNVWRLQTSDGSIIDVQRL